MGMEPRGSRIGGDNRGAPFPPAGGVVERRGVSVVVSGFRAARAPPPWRASPPLSRERERERGRIFENVSFHPGSEQCELNL